ncbi:GNAT family N-acetyltransferase [Paenibacillus filicis]|uniref:GNAT family N-acetyltransferase n=1 Tax=Paenibacillus gyeongsangnamensis TaxID=3388067 RepID=A0ABT4QJQ7_9BACL|nr:GNAT family N-acetyltransferase [Paenibacillus filicis]MCZ8517113.1 GNAT family N-acetyltransferase [Paenibacillus filicis]
MTDSQTRSFPVAQAVPEDAERIAPLFDQYRVFYKASSDLPQAISFLRSQLDKGTSVIYFAYGASRREPIGFTQLYPSFSSVSMRPIWILNDLFVSPDARGQGVAQQLMEAARLHAAETGAIRLELSTACDNAAAQRLYESLSYVRDEQFYHYSLQVQPV